jgi:hypothetical protein
MTARAGMSAVITHMRGLCNAGTADYTLAGSTYWSDDHLQTALDRYRKTVRRQELSPTADYSGGTYSYTEYPFGHVGAWIEGTATGWAVRTADGSSAPSYTVNFDAKVITFAADTGGSAYFLDCRVYDVFNAAADVWQQKGAAVAANVHWSSDNHKFNAGDEYQHCIHMARVYRSMTGPSVSQWLRVDEA